MESWQQRFRALNEEGRFTPESLLQVIQGLVGLPSVFAAVGVVRQPNHAFVPVTSIVCKPSGKPYLAAGQEAFSVALGRVVEEQTLLVCEPVGEGLEVLVAICDTDSEIPFAVCVLNDSTDSESQSALVDGLRWALGEISRWTQATSPPGAADEACKPDTEAPSDGSDERVMWECCQLLAEPRQAAFELASRLSEFFAGQTVFLGEALGRSRTKMTAMSGLPEFQRPSPLVNAAEEVLHEGRLRGYLRVIARSDDSVPHTEAEAWLFALVDAEMIAVGPIDAGSEAHSAAWIVLIHSSSTERPVEQGHAGPLSDIDAWKKQIERRQTLAKTAMGVLRTPPSVWTTTFRPRRGAAKSWLRKRSTWTTAAAFLAVLALPMPYRITCHSQLRPATRRFVPAPYDGVLEKVMVEPGDLVQAGQLLARMDGREIQWQLSAAQAELSRYGKEHDTAMAQGDTAAAQVAGLQMKRNQVEMELLQNRLHHLEVRSPLEGLVLGGDPRRMEGARLKLGQSLFEVGPLDAMVIEVEIPDEEIAYVSVGDSVRTNLEAYPLRRLQGTIERISPQAELRERQQVFVAEVALVNPNHIFRPGMAGRARIKTRWHPLGWNFFHHAWEKLTLWLAI